MRKLSKILALVLVLMMMFAVVSAFSFTTSAANIPGGTVLYLVPNANWNQSNARFAAYFFGDGEAWVSMTKVAGQSNLYEVTVPAGKNFTNVIFCRMNPSASANNWNNKWNQTADLTYNGTSNCYTVKEGTWDSGGGTWSTYGSSCLHTNLGPAATCTTAQECLDCGDPVVSALGHTYNSAHLCTVCNTQASFTVAGSGAHLGTEWDTGNTANDMTYADGVYTKVYTNVAAGSYALKVVRDHDWGTAYPSADKAYTVATTGSTVTVTLKGTTVTVTVEAPHVHNYEAVVTAPTYTEGGYTTYTCSCGDSYVDDYTEKVVPAFPEAVVTPIPGIVDDETTLTFALNFGIKGATIVDGELVIDEDILPEDYLAAVFETYGKMYVDYRLKIEGLSVDGVTFNANGNANGFLAGQYDAWSKSWVTVPFDDVTIPNGGSLMIMEYAAEMMGKPGLRMVLEEIVTVVVDFDCGVYFTPEFLAANPDMVVTLELIVFNEDENGEIVDVINVAENVFTVPHTHDYTEVVTAPTCTEAGYTTYTCACGDTYTGDEVAALGHKDAAPEDHECDVCGLSISDCVDADKDHNCDICDDVMSKCSDDDQNHFCDICGVQNSHCIDIPPYDHNCDWCGEKMSEHNFVEGTCDICGEEDPNYVPPHVHAHEAVVTAPTCTEAGYTTYTCACGDTYTGDEVAALGHTWANCACTVCDAVLPTLTVIDSFDFTTADGLAAALASGKLGYTGTFRDNGDSHQFAADSSIQFVVPANTTVTLTGHSTGYGVFTVYVNGVKHDMAGSLVFTVTEESKVVIVPDETATYSKAYLKGIALAEYIDRTITSDTTITFGSEGNYKDSLVDFSGIQIGDNGGNNSQVKNGSFDLLLKAGTKVVIHGYPGYTSYQLNGGDEITDEYYTYLALEDTVLKVTPVNGNNYFYSIEITLHTGIVHVEAKAATCTEAGYGAHYVCDCHGVLTDKGEVAALGHNYEAVVTAPTCTSVGYTTYTCACGDTYTGDEVAALEHEYVYGKCTVCGATDPNYVPYVNTLVVGDTNKIVVDGDTFNDYNLPIEWVAFVADEKATYTFVGNNGALVFIFDAELNLLCGGTGTATLEAGTYLICIGNGMVGELNVAVTKTALPHEHVWSDATCTEPAKCECGETQGEALGHDYADGLCTRCGAEDPEHTPVNPPVGGDDGDDEGDGEPAGEETWISALWAMLLKFFEWIAAFFKGLIA